MCGIAGLIGADRVDPHLLARMCDTIAHRGPDDEGQWIDQEAVVGLGHRRLSIVDLSPLGHQPMASRDGRFVLSFNGEIYNPGGLRTELEARSLMPPGGWRSHSDTETLVESIAAIGLEATLKAAVGMFAFALWDRKDRRLHLVRDRFGEKPLYYGWAGRDFVFASELKAIRVHPQFSADIDRDSLGHFAARTYVPAPRSIYRGIFKLEPGCILTVEPGPDLVRRTDAPIEGKASGGLQLARYWSYRDVMRAGFENPIGDRAEALDLLAAVLGQAVRDQAVADVPVGAFLSGGIDSSTIVALYQKYSSIPVRTFSIGFEEAEFDEARYAKRVAAHFGTIHHEHIVTVREARDVIPHLPAMYDEPFADSSQIPTHLVSRFAREKVTVALTGDGGDELFGGYNRHVMAPKFWNRLRRLPRPLRAAAALPLSHVPGRIWNSAASMFGSGIGGKVQKGLRVVSQARRFDDVYSSFLDEWSQEQSPVRGAHGGDSAPFDMDFAPGAPDALRMMYCDAVSYLPDDILCKVDRASMAVSLETRVPFLDHRVAALAARIPLSMKVSDGRGKQILRDLLYREAPRMLFERPKSGFAIPIGQWIKGDLRPWAEELLDPARMAGEGWFDATVVQRRWRDHLSGQRDSTPALWAVLMFQAWLREQQASLSKAA